MMGHMYLVQDRVLRSGIHLDNLHVGYNAWYKWLRRRSQRTRLTWKRYRRLLARFPLPQPRITVRIWGFIP